MHPAVSVEVSAGQLQYGGAFRHSVCYGRFEGPVEEERARDWVKRALLLDPDNLSMRYNLACSLAQELGDQAGAIETMQPFFEKVNSPMHIRHLEVDPDLDSIRDDPRFKTMLAATKKRLGMKEAAVQAPMPAQQGPAPA
jgi:hypothetical protein